MLVLDIDVPCHYSLHLHRGMNTGCHPMQTAAENMTSDKRRLYSSLIYIGEDCWQNY